MSLVLEALRRAAKLYGVPVMRVDVAAELRLVGDPGEMEPTYRGLVELLNSGEARRYRDDDGRTVWWPEPPVEPGPPADPLLTEIREELDL